MLSVSHRRKGSVSPKAAATASPVTRNTSVGPYRVRVELATGGMSVVYLACADGVHGVRALKVISPEHASSPGYAEMFSDEAEVVSRIRHPNVCSVLDYDVVQGECYIAMEYLIGEPASSIRKKLGRLGAREPTRHALRVARLMADVCEGLHAAHELTDLDGEPMNVVHRDVSPENLFLTYDGIAKVVDFGLVSLEGQRHRTRTGILKGKVAYIAPELLEGEQADRRVDVWGAGVVTWELLTGERLFLRDTDLDTLRAVASAPIPRPSELRPGLPAALDEVVMRALERSREKRYSSALELGRDLLRIATSGPEVVSTGDLAQWMTELFPGGKGRRCSLIDLALQADDAAKSHPPAEDPKLTPSAPPPALPVVDSLASTPRACSSGSCSSPDSDAAVASAAKSIAPPPVALPSVDARTPRAPSFLVAASVAVGVLLGWAGAGGVRALLASDSVPPAPTAAPPSAPEVSAETATIPLGGQPSVAAGANLQCSLADGAGDKEAPPFQVRGPVAIEVSGTPDQLVLQIRALER